MKKALSIIMTIALAMGSVGLSANTPNTKAYAENTESAFMSNSGGAFDLGIANDEKLIEMLKKSGEIAEDATPGEAEEALRIFLNNKMKDMDRQSKQLKNENKAFIEKLKEKGLNYGILKGKGIKKGQGNNVGEVVKETWDGNKFTAKILAILIEYPDYPHNSITDESDMYYEDYTTEHYEDMLFGVNGYTGPNGENLISMKQHYEAQSGGSYSVDGKVAGWYTASEPAIYYGNNNNGKNRELIEEALLAVANDNSVDLSEFDQEDVMDLDGDGNYLEPDGLIDHVMVFHSSVGEEAGGGELGDDAIWSHSSSLYDVFPLEGTTTDVPYWGGLLAAYDYTVQPGNAAAGVCTHEYAHDIGYPDEYDTDYTGLGSPVSYWSVMDSGSWAGLIPGTEPTGFSPLAKEYFQGKFGGNWLSGMEIDIENIPEEGIEVLLDQASTKGTNNDVLKVNMPEKENIINIPYSGVYEYFSGSGNALNNSMVTNVDLPSGASAKLSFKAWYQIEKDWDYASILVNGVSIPGNITTTENPYEQNPGNGITGHSDGWVNAEFDLSQFAGQENIKVEFNYWTDKYVTEPGFYADDIVITVDDNQVLFDDGEGATAFELEGFELNKGKFNSAQYYLIEWRNHQGVDAGLGHIKRGDSVMSFDPGMVIWYVDESYDDNWTGIHPGDGFVGVVDADQFGNRWDDKEIGISRYQIHDSSFSLQKSEKMYLEYKDDGIHMRDNHTKANPLFDDSFDYSNPDQLDSGRNIPSYGLKIRVIGENADRSVGKILLFK